MTENRKFVLMGNLLAHMGIDRARIQFSWISSAEATKFAWVAEEVAAAITLRGPSDKLVKKADYRRGWMNETTKNLDNANLQPQDNESRKENR